MRNIQSVVLTGASGFVGRYLAHELVKRDFTVRLLVRTGAEAPDAFESSAVGDLRQPLGVQEALVGADAVVHAAALTLTAGSVIGASGSDYFRSNTDATLRLARASSKAGVRRFVYLSSISAQTGPVARDVLTEDLPPRPVDAYGRSKLVAEQRLAELDLDWVALRPIPIYGPGMAGKMATLIKLARSPFPLPFGEFTARRSLLCLKNLGDAVETVLTVPGPLQRPLIVAEPNPLTVAEIIGYLRKGLGRPPGLLNVPMRLMRFAAGAAGQGHVLRRFEEPFVADPSALIDLGWRPTVEPSEWLPVLAQKWQPESQSKASTTSLVPSAR